MVLKTGRRCMWEDIEVGEVFAWNGCWCIFYKKSEDGAKLLDSTGIYRPLNGYPGYDYYDDDNCFEGLFFEILTEHLFYKLPKSVQALWKEV